MLFRLFLLTVGLVSDQRTPERSTTSHSGERLSRRPLTESDDLAAGGQMLFAKNDIGRRAVLSTCLAFIPTAALAAATFTSHQYINVIEDPKTYSALVYAPPNASSILLVLHGAGINERDAFFSFTEGEHRGLAPGLLYSDRAPRQLAENFVVVAPFVGKGKRSFYEEPRSKLLDFVDWLRSDANTMVDMSSVDFDRMFLFGFSDGATVAIELATTRRFRGVAIAAYGFSGRLPERALLLLKDVPLWVFHSVDDVIFPVVYSDKLVKSLRSISSSPSNIKYTRYDKDQEGFTGSVRGHSTGITASKFPELYGWMLKIP